MPLKFYNKKNYTIQRLNSIHSNDSLLFSNDTLNLYGKFSDTFMLLGEHREIMNEQNYNLLSEEKKQEPRQTYYVTDGTLGLHHPAYITVNNGNLIILTNEVI